MMVTILAASLHFVIVIVHSRKLCWLLYKVICGSLFTVFTLCCMSYLPRRGS